MYTSTDTKLNNLQLIILRLKQCFLLLTSKSYVFIKVVTTDEGLNIHMYRYKLSDKRAINVLGYIKESISDGNEADKAVADLLNDLK